MLVSSFSHMCCLNINNEEIRWEVYRMLYLSKSPVNLKYYKIKKVVLKVLLKKKKNLKNKKNSLSFTFKKVMSWKTKFLKVRYLRPTRMAKTKKNKTGETKCWHGCQAKRTPFIASGKHKVALPFWKVWQFLTS